MSLSSRAKRRKIGGKAGSRPGLLLIGLLVLAFAGVAAWWGFSQGSSSLGRLSGDLHSLYIVEDDRIFYGQHSGIQVSSDGGKKWTAPSGTGDAMAISASPEQPETIYQAGHNLFLKSTDGGKSWQEPGFGNLPGTDIHGFAVTPDGEALYANIAGRGLYASWDEGESWEFVSRATADAMAMAAGPGETRVLYALSMGSGPIRSTDGGNTWERIRGVSAPSMSGVYAHPVSGNLYLTGEAGVYRSEDRGETWESLGPGVPMALVAADAQNETTLVAVAKNGKVYRSDDGGRSWRE
jgi:photosystem II stability/assembly factor-like uncharacterized protein